MSTAPKRGDKVQIVGTDHKGTVTFINFYGTSTSVGMRPDGTPSQMIYIVPTDMIEIIEAEEDRLTPNGESVKTTRAALAQLKRILEDQETQGLIMTRQILRERVQRLEQDLIDAGANDDQ